MAATDVIFRIGTVGISQASAELAMVAAALYKIGREIAEQVKEADKFSDAWSRLSSEQLRQVNAMDTATKGWVSTMSTMESAAKMGIAGVNATTDGMSALALVAADAAKRLGEGPEGAARRLNELTNSLIKGSERGLKPYGIELQANASLTEKQASAFEQLKAKADGLTLELDGLDDKWDALSNTIEKQRGILYDNADKIGIVGFAADALGGIFDEVREKISDYNKMMELTNGQYHEWSMSSDRLGEFLYQQGLSISENAMRFLGFADALDVVIGKQKELNQQMLEGAGLTGGGYTGGPASTGDMGQSSEYLTPGGESDWAADWELTPDVPIMPESTKPEPKPGRGGGRGGGGGGRGKPPQYAGAELPALIEISEVHTKIVDLMAQEKAIQEWQTAADENRAELAKDEIGTLENRLALLESQNSEEWKRIELLQQIAEIDPASLSIDEKHEMWDFELESQERKNKLLLEEMEYKAALGDQTAQNFLAEKKAAEALYETYTWYKATIEAVTNVSRILFDAMWQGSDASAKAVKKAIAQVMQAMCVEYAVKGAAEAAEALIAIAMNNEAGAVKHGLAAAEAIAVSVAAGMAALALGAGASGGAGGSEPDVGGGGGGGYEGHEDYSDRQGDGVEVVIKVEGSMSSLFNHLEVEQRRRNKSGEGGGFF